MILIDINAPGRATAENLAIMESWLATDLLTDPQKLALGGFSVGLLFGFCAQHSRFCLRSACIEFWSGGVGEKFAIWLLVFGSALAAVQALMMSGHLPTDGIRQIESPGTMSGAIIGGLMFGVGMILARGCASRLLVLSATGNLRAFVAGLVVTVVAQSSLSGVLSPLRQALSGPWVIGAYQRNMALHLPEGSGLAAGLAFVVAALYCARRFKVSWGTQLTGAGVGLAVAAGWAFTSKLAHVSFNIIPVGSVTFTGPSADTLMVLISKPTVDLGFGIGLVPGVFLGSFAASVLFREFHIQSFDQGTGTARYLIGAALMGFGGMLAGGCAVGAGVTGGSVLSLTAWVALLGMWIGAGLAGLALEPGVARRGMALIGR